MPANGRWDLIGRLKGKIGWRERNQQDASNLMFFIKLLSKHVSGIIMPIIRRKRVCTAAYGVLHWLWWLWLCGAGTRAHGVLHWLWWLRLYGAGTRAVCTVKFIMLKCIVFDTLYIHIGIDVVSSLISIILFPWKILTKPQAASVYRSRFNPSVIPIYVTRLAHSVNLLWIWKFCESEERRKLGKRTDFYNVMQQSGGACTRLWHINSPAVCRSTRASCCVCRTWFGLFDIVASGDRSIGDPVGGSKSSGSGDQR